MKHYSPCDKCGSVNFKLIPNGADQADVHCWECNEFKLTKPLNWAIYGDKESQDGKVGTI